MNDGTGAAAVPEQASGAGPFDRRQVIGIAALVAAVVAGFASAAPTGLASWDWALKAAMAALFVVSVAAAPRWVAIAVAVPAAAIPDGTVWMIVGAAGLLLAVAAAAFPDEVGPFSVLAPALSIQGLLRLAPVGFFGLTALVAGGAVALALLLGYRSAEPPVRRLARRSAAAVLLLTVVASGIGGLAMLSARSDVEDGIALARDGLDAARAGEPEEVVDSLERAAAHLNAARDRTDSPWTQPLRLIPVAAQHRNAVVVATGQGSSIAEQASRATIEADISSITMSAGSVDLAALAAMEPDLVETAQLLEEGIVQLRRARSDWLVPQVATRMEDLTEEMAEVLPEARLAADAAAVMPGLLGQDGPRRYFIAFGSPAESRELGGFVGSWALIEFDAGDVSLVEAGRIADLYELSRSNAPLGPLGYPEWYVYTSTPEYWPQNITSSPDLRTVAAATRDLFDGLGGAPIDGLVYLDGYALADMLELTGPIRIDGLEQRLSAGNAADFFFDEQYRVDDRDGLKAELSEIFSGVFEGVLDTRLPGPERLGRVLGPAAREGRLQVATFDDDENAFLRSVKLQRTFRLPRSTSDAFAIVQTHGAASKLDLYLHRDVEYSMTVNEDGSVEGSVVVELDSRVPDDAPAYTLGADGAGINHLFLSFYSPHEVVAARLDNEGVVFDSVDEYGYRRYEVVVEFPANETRTIEFDFVGDLDPETPYRVSVWHQPLVNDDTVEVRYQDSNGRWSSEFVLTEDTVVDSGG